ncbi:hypothetical protein SASPL_142189 [Salvia splendens]|uniref:ZF-HD dimerization-type domain-containing protein n=1 Tax=Salvia splendens TaxID=180675 RepID=A0A8X8WJV8_SALSN|nr:hypothetical protein SASPL_142189 [Salvia splendens]
MVSYLQRFADTVELCLIPSYIADTVELCVIPDVFSADMDLANSTVKTPEAESETPTRIQPAPKSAPPFSNGVLKRHAPLLHHPVVVTYKECLKNHAAALGGHAVDGCGEFMPAPASDPALPTSLKCAACNCHRNFHRRDPEDPPTHAPPPLRRAGD